MFGEKAPILLYDTTACKVGIDVLCYYPNCSIVSGYIEGMEGVILAASHDVCSPILAMAGA